MSELQSLTGTINYDRVYPTIDASLSIEGAAADAKAVGDALGVLEEGIGNTVTKDGTVPMTGDLDMAEHRVKHVANPAETGDAVNLGYVRDHVYPVGAIYMSVANASPASFLGGTWTQLKDRFLLGAGSSYAAGGTGGEASHTLTTSEFPEHAHGMKVATTSGTPGYFPVIVTEGWGPEELETKARGSTGAHNNMPPYLVVYMWKRTA